MCVLSLGATCETNGLNKYGALREGWARGRAPAVARMFLFIAGQGVVQDIFEEGCVFLSKAT